MTAASKMARPLAIILFCSTTKNHFKLKKNGEREGKKKSVLATVTLSSLCVCVYAGRAIMKWQDGPKERDVPRLAFLFLVWFVFFRR